MSTKIGSNISSLKAQRHLADATSRISSTYERLSSGLRINKASDDAAGLSVLSSLNNDKRVFSQGIRNFNDGVSLLNIADGALNELSNITVRLKELAEQAANGVYGVSQRTALDSEAQALSKEFTRIARSTTFNTDGALDMLHAGFSPSSAVMLRLGNTQGVTTIAQLDLLTAASARSAMGVIDSTLKRISTEMGAIGSTQSRLGVAAANVMVARENFESAASRIIDADVAAESSELVRTRILQQAASAVLAQANQQPALALTLLK